MNITPIFTRTAGGGRIGRKSLYEELLKSPFQRNFKMDYIFNAEDIINQNGDFVAETITDRNYIKYGDRSLKITINPSQDTEYFEITFPKPLNLLDRSIGISLFMPPKAMLTDQNAKFANLPFYLVTDKGLVTRWIPQQNGDRRYEGWNYVLGDHQFYEYPAGEDKGLLSKVTGIRFNIYHKPEVIEPFDIYLNALVSWDDVRIPAVRIEFDDNHPTVYNNAFPIMSSRGIRGCTHVVTQEIGATQGNHPDQLRKMHDAGWDICSHSVTHPYFDQITNEEIEYELEQSQKDLLDIGLRRGPQVFVAPRGNMVPYMREHARKVYKMYRGTGYFRGETHTPIDPYDLKCLGRGASTLESTITLIDDIVEKGGFTGLMWHGEIGEPWGNNPGWQLGEFADLMDYLLEKNVHVITYSDQIPFSSF